MEGVGSPGPGAVLAAGEHVAPSNSGLFTCLVHSRGSVGALTVPRALEEKESRNTEN